MNRILRFANFVALAALLLAAAARPAQADSFNVSLDTSSLSGTQVLAFLLTDGDGVVDNSATLSGFAFGGGAAQGTPDYLGSTGVSGDLTSGIAMDDTSLSTAIFTQDFTPGSSLSFLLNITDNFAGGTPDTFAMEICNSTLTLCYSDDTSTGAMLVLNLLGGPLAPSDFILNGASDQNLPAPVVTEGSSGNAPEPSSLLLLAAALLSLRMARHRRRDEPNSMAA
jgi:hypothetical protein